MYIFLKAKKRCKKKRLNKLYLPPDFIKAKSVCTCFNRLIESMFYLHVFTYNGTASTEYDNCDDFDIVFPIP